MTKTEQWQAFRLACVDDDLEAAVMVLDSGLDVNGEFGQPHTRPLMVPAQLEFSDMTRELMDILLARGADLEGRDAGGRTTLMYAEGSHGVSAMRYLIDRGADVGATDMWGKNLLLYALGVKPDDHDMEVLRFLVAQGVDVHQASNKGPSPHEIASDRGIDLATLD